MTGNADEPNRGGTETGGRRAGTGAHNNENLSQRAKWSSER
ncbi:hypothetical protein I551_5910 [Mycobacterium ulcerans str. Harvey]|uniref:Uncharacterized protein n=1 Tax=Mycobacterium ulcerans str. Harvey TaxID=1299332 RepID=A0ABN0QS47_MYCUL|nr:hypothetical protein MMSP_2517 [Mycobacterium sp. 012931]EPQ74909.1 hypothetical protein MMEU_2569 [Mycobacterium marinum str. Europe]EUA87593.1 hypothetical protein I551_5910 [Mycobacterium ulcerans str. Harvey]